MVVNDNMRVVTCHITIGSIDLYWVNEVQIDDTWNELSATGFIKLPLNVKYFKRTSVSGYFETIVDNVINIGDPITIRLGYDDNNITVFTGWITKVRPSLPVTIEFEDDMYLLKKCVISHSINPTIKDVTVQPVLSLPSLISNLQKSITTAFNSGRISKNIKLICTNTSITNTGNWNVVNNTTVSWFLDQLKNNFNCVSFTRGGNVYIGRAYPRLGNKPFDSNFNLTPKVFKLRVNTEEENSLFFSYAADKPINVRYVSMVRESGSKKRKQIQVFGKGSDPSGTLISYNVGFTSLADLQNQADETIAQYKFTGFTGSFTAFGSPVVTHNDVVKLIDNELPDFNGLYLVKRVQILFGYDVGYRQVIYLDRLFE